MRIYGDDGQACASAVGLDSTGPADCEMPPRRDSTGRGADRLAGEPGCLDAALSGASGRTAGGPTYPQRSERKFHPKYQQGKRDGRSGVRCGAGPTCCRSKCPEAYPEANEYESSAVLPGTWRAHSPPHQDDDPGHNHADPTDQPKPSRHRNPLCRGHRTAHTDLPGTCLVAVKLQASAVHVSVYQVGATSAEPRLGYSRDEYPSAPSSRRRAS